MKKFYRYGLGLLLLVSVKVQAQNQQVIDAIIKEAKENSQLETLAHELLDGIGPRLTTAVLLALGGGGGAAVFALAVLCAEHAADGHNGDDQDNHFKRVHIVSPLRQFLFWV